MSKDKTESKVGPIKSLSVIYKLEYPINWASEVVEEIELKRLRGKHIKKIGANPDMEIIMRLASKSSGQPPSFFEELDAADTMGVSEVIGNFLDNGRETGKIK